MQIKDSVVVITGGASGLGEATARSLSAMGAKVAIFDIAVERGERIAGSVEVDQDGRHRVFGKRVLEPFHIAGDSQLGSQRAGGGCDLGLEDQIGDVGEDDVGHGGARWSDSAIVAEIPEALFGAMGNGRC